jgi:tight adherence protein B
MILTPTAIVIAIAVLATLSAGGLAYAVLYGRISGGARVEKRMGQVQARAALAPAAAAVRSDPAKRRKSVQDTLREIEEKQKARARQSVRPPLTLKLQQAGLSWSKQTFWIISLFIGGFVLGLCLILGMSPLVSAGFAIAGFLGVPRWLVNFLRKRRMKKFLNEFPNAVDVIVRGVKAGLPLNDCIRIIANETVEPVKSEFRIISESQSMGLGLADAVARLPERIPAPEANFFAIVIAIQQKSGGNLSDALGNLSRVLRERKKMKGKIGAMSMEAKASAVIIGALPFVVMILVYISGPDYIALLFTDPLGHLILAASGFWMCLGVLVMRKMINFDF